MFGTTGKVVGPTAAVIIAAILVGRCGYAGDPTGQPEKGSPPIPAAVKAAAEKYLGANTDYEVGQDMERRIPLYEVSVEVGGFEKEVKLTETGDVMEVEEEIPAERLPAAVKNRLSQAFPGAVVAEAELVQLFYYDVELVVDGRIRKVQIFPSGNFKGKVPGMKAPEESAGKEDDDD